MLICKFKSKIIFIIFILLNIFYLLYTQSNAFEYPDKPKTSVIQDYANIISPDIEDKLSTQFLDFKENKNIDIVITTVSDAIYEDKSDYVRNLKKWWGIGEKNNGMIIVIFPEDIRNNVYILADDSINKYLDRLDQKDLEILLEMGLEKDKFDEVLDILSDSLDVYFEDYKKIDTFLQQLSDIINLLIHKIKPKEPSEEMKKIQSDIKKAIKVLNSI